MVVLVSHIVHFFIDTHRNLFNYFTYPLIWKQFDFPELFHYLVFMHTFIFFPYRSVVGFNINLSILNSHLKMHMLKLRLNIKQLT